MSDAEVLAMRVAYDGTGFAGWQRQPAAPTVQQAIESALATVHGVPAGRVALVGAGRTDAGVHALGQVASWRAPSARAPEVLHAALARLLPPEIRVLALRRMPPSFHARRSALGKVYRYRLVHGRPALPFEVRWCWPVPRPLDLEAIRGAARALEGRHDFASFAGAGSPVRTTVRTIRRIEVIERNAGGVDIDVEGDGFLYRMVRTLVGLLVEIGAGRRPAHDAARVLAARDRRAAGPPAPAAGLCLQRVLYPPQFRL